MAWTSAVPRRSICSGSKTTRGGAAGDLWKLSIDSTLLNVMEYNRSVLRLLVEARSASSSDGSSKRKYWKVMWCMYGRVDTEVKAARKGAGDDCHRL
jgi:hypothetical protein